MKSRDGPGSGSSKKLELYSPIFLQNFIEMYIGVYSLMCNSFTMRFNWPLKICIRIWGHTDRNCNYSSYKKNHNLQ